MIRIVLLLVLWAATANAAPPSRVLVADSDPELVRAIDKSLAPWRIAVIAAPSVPDEAHAHAQADAVDAQFIVWREGDQLVVFDRAQGTAERRPARAGPFDPVSAAAAALTVKTMMRLPPLADAPGDGTNGGRLVTGPEVPPGSGRPELRMQIGVGARVARGSQTDLGGRAMLSLLLRPSPQLGLRLGIGGDLGTSASVSHAGFKGTFADWAVLGVATWSWSIGRFEIGPTLGAGVSRSHLDGEIGMMQSVESATLPVVRGGVSVRRPLGRWSIGASLDADLVLATPTYMKNSGMGSSAVFEVPGFSTVVGLFAAADLGP
jgi:hypothetical protein